MVITYEEENTSNSKQNQEVVLFEHKHICSVILHKDFPEVELPQSSSQPSKNTSVKMLGWNNHNNTQTVDPSKIIKTLREMVKRVVMDFRLSSSNLNEEDGDVVEAIPISFRPPQPTNVEMIMSPKKRVTTLLVGETLVSFQLPYNCLFCPEDINMLAEERRRETVTQNINEEIIYNVSWSQYTFLQRLNGWKLERRQRVNGRFDLYYHHLQSRRVFRSIAEVVNFFLYEVYPDKPVQKPAAKSKMGEDDPSAKKTERKEKREMPLKRKFDLNDDYDQNQIYDLDDDHDNECEFSKDETVGKFLAEAYDNLMNSSDHAKKSKSFNLDINEEISEEDHTVKKFMAEAYNNLMNSQKEVKEQKGKDKEKKKEKIGVNGNVIFTGIDCESSYVATTSRGGGGSSSTMEVAKSMVFSQRDECDLINHIQESSDMFDLALFLAINRGRQHE